MRELKIKKKQFIAILDDKDLIACGSSVSDVISEALGKIGVAKDEVMTVYYGAEAQADEADDVAQKIRERFHLEAEIAPGGQQHYYYIISLE